MQAERIRYGSNFFELVVVYVSFFSSSFRFDSFLLWLKWDFSEWNHIRWNSIFPSHFCFQWLLIILFFSQLSLSYSIDSLFILLDLTINLYQITLENANIFPKYFFIRSHLVHFFFQSSVRYNMCVFCGRFFSLFFHPKKEMIPKLFMYVMDLTEKKRRKIIGWTKRERKDKTTKQFAGAFFGGATEMLTKYCSSKKKNDHNEIGIIN